MSGLYMYMDMRLYVCKYVCNVFINVHVRLCVWCSHVNRIGTTSGEGWGGAGGVVVNRGCEWVVIMIDIVGGARW